MVNGLLKKLFTLNIFLLQGSRLGALFFTTKKNKIMTKSEREDAIISALTKICISLLVRNFLKKDGELVLEEMLSILKDVPDAEEPYYSRANSALEYLLKDTENYLIKNKAFNEKHYQK